MARSSRLALPQKSETFLDRVSTGSGSDLIRDQHANLLTLFLTTLVGPGRYRFLY